MMFLLTKMKEEVFDAHVSSWIWFPPHIFPASSHVFVFPNLMTTCLMKTLGKIADTMFTVKPRSFIWPTEILEPLTIAFIKPLLSHSPWKHSKLPSMATWESDMR